MKYLNQKQAGTVSLLAACFFLLPLSPGAEASPDNSWSTTDGGGGAASGGGYAIETSMGGVDSGELRGGNYTLVGGFVAGLAQAMVPDVTGLTLPVANERIVTAALVVGAISYGFDGNVPDGSVVSQTPIAEDQVEYGTAVDLYVSLGPPPAEGEFTEEGEPEATIAVPDVLGKPEGEATEMLQTLGFQVEHVEVPSKVQEGHIITQTPESGVEMDHGSIVRLDVSIGGAAYCGCGTGATRSNTWYGDILLLLVLVAVLSRFHKPVTP